ncbi:MAG TPA: hypothetical protein VG146_07565 [Verrucomicrobiae bacterium]|nr:hypothetical protein [Verrucomicrobiae bacterium]
MSTHQTETAFLRRIILYDDGEERRKLETSIAQVQRDQRCVQRVAYVMAPFPLLAIAGVFYAEILQEGFPYSGFGLGLRLLCVLGLASLICLAGFAGLLTVYRLKLNRLRKECLQLVNGLLESRLGKPQVPTLPTSHRVFDGGEAFQASAPQTGLSPAAPVTVRA